MLKPLKFSSLQQPVNSTMFSAQIPAATLSKHVEITIVDTQHVLCILVADLVKGLTEKS